MKIAALLLLAMSAAVDAAPFEPAAPDCAALLKPYGARLAAPAHLLELPGRLVYIGADHAVDPAHPQFADIERRWNAARPQLAFYEGPQRALPAGRDDVIRQAGEAGFVRYLAARDGVPLARLEPDPEEEGAHVMQRFSAEQTVLFYALREAARLRERRGFDEAHIAPAIDQLLARMAALMPVPLANSAELARAYRKYWGQPEQWWQAPAAWFDPDGEAGGFLPAVNARSSAFRDLTMYNRLSAAALAGKRVFAVVGRDHVSHQAEALACALDHENHGHE